MDVVLCALLDHLLRPKAGLDLSDMGFAQEIHAKPRLADTSADGERQFVLEQFLVEQEFFPVVGAGYLQLTQQGLLVDPDPHG